MTKNLWESTAQFVQQTPWWEVADSVLVGGGIALGILFLVCILVRIDNEERAEWEAAKTPEQRAAEDRAWSDNLKKELERKADRRAA